MRNFTIFLWILFLTSCAKEGEDYYPHPKSSSENSHSEILSLDSLEGKKLILFSEVKYIIYDGKIVDSINFIIDNNDSVIWLFNKKNLFINEKSYNIEYSENNITENLFNSEVTKSLTITYYSGNENNTLQYFTKIDNSIIIYGYEKIIFNAFKNSYSFEKLAFKITN